MLEKNQLVLFYHSYYRDELLYINNYGVNVIIVMWTALLWCEMLNYYNIIRRIWL